MLSLRSEIRRLPEVGESVRDALGRRARTLGRAYRLKGLGGSIVLVAVVIPDSVLSVEWYALLETVPEPAHDDGSGLEYRWGDEADLPLLLTLRPTEGLAERLRQGDRVYIALERDRLVGYMWFRAGAWTENEVTFALRPDERWAYDGFVPAEHRGRHIHSAIGRAAVIALRREGIMRILSGVDHLNDPSMRSSARRGARQLESALVVGTVGLGFLRRSPAGGGRTRWTRFRRAAGTTVSLPPWRGVVAGR